MKIPDNLPISHAIILKVHSHLMKTNAKSDAASRSVLMNSHLLFISNSDKEYKNIRFEFAFDQCKSILRQIELKYH